VESFETFPEQDEAKALLEAALTDGPAHAYLFHGPRGVGKRRAARAFAGELLGDRERVDRGTHPDLYLLEPLGDQIRIDAVRELRRDLHMRPFEADRRIYLILSAELMNEEAADALLKDLEEPPPYAVVVLVANELGPLPETILSRCQLVPFKRLSEKAVREAIAARAPDLGPEQVTALARMSAGRLDRADRLLDPKTAARRETLLQVARAVYLEPAFEPADAAEAVLAGVEEKGEDERKRAEEDAAPLELTARERDQRLRRAQRGAEREELLAALEELAAWYRDLLAVAVGAERAVVHYDRLAELSEDATRERMAGAEAACETVRATWRAFEEFNISPSLALEALFTRLRRELAGPVGAPA
jgi:DNA polymerase-3 subunit delta'